MARHMQIVYIRPRPEPRLHNSPLIPSPGTSPTCHNDALPGKLGVRGWWGLGNIRCSRLVSRPLQGLSLVPRCFSLESETLWFTSVPHCPPRACWFPLLAFPKVGLVLAWDPLANGYFGSKSQETYRALPDGHHVMAGMSRNHEFGGFFPPFLESFGLPTLIIRQASNINAICCLSPAFSPTLILLKCEICLWRVGNGPGWVSALLSGNRRSRFRCRGIFFDSQGAAPNFLVCHLLRGGSRIVRLIWSQPVDGAMLLSRRAGSSRRCQTADEPLLSHLFLCLLLGVIFALIPESRWSMGDV